MPKHDNEGIPAYCPYDVSPRGASRNAIETDSGCKRSRCATCGFNPIERELRIARIRSGDMAMRAVIIKDDNGQPIGAKVCRSLIVKRGANA